MRSLPFVLTTLILSSMPAAAALKTRAVQYKEGKTTLEGTLVYDEAVSSRRPGVLVVHDWMGPNDFVQKRATELVNQGYAAFVVDMYGKKNRPKDQKEARELSRAVKNNRAQMRARARAAMDVFLKQPGVDAQKAAAIGYCFGGTTVLELARSGASLAGVVSFHGGLDTPNPQDARNIKAKVLVLHGAIDPHVPPDEVTAFEKEMNDAQVDWTLVKYSGAVHAFAVPTAGNDPSKGAAYNAVTDKRSWEAMSDFLKEIFAQ